MTMPNSFFPFSYCVILIDFRKSTDAYELPKNSSLSENGIVTGLSLDVLLFKTAMCVVN